jgi:hypothetical protein
MVATKASMFYKYIILLLRYLPCIQIIFSGQIRAFALLYPLCWFKAGVD